MEEAPENSNESMHSAHANEINEWKESVPMWQFTKPH